MNSQRTKALKLNHRLLVVAELNHETNTFIHIPTDLDWFSIKRGAEILATKGDVSDLGGFLQAAEEHHWEVLPTISLNGFPSGTVKDHVIETFKVNFLNYLPFDFNRPIDAVVFLSHGAMVSESILDVEGTILEWFRQHPALRSTPIFGTLDPHGNFTQKMADHSTCLLAYRENPHTDSRETSFRIAEIMEHYFKNQLTAKTFYRHARILWPPTGTSSSENPIQTLQTMARDFEMRNPQVLAINVFSGFPFSDSPEAGVSFTIAATDKDQVDEYLTLLVSKAEEMKAGGFPQEFTVDEAIEKISKIEGLGLLVEPSDNIGGGGIGDGIEVLCGIIKSTLRPAGVILQAPDVVKALYRLPINSEQEVTLGRSYESEGHEIKIKLKIIYKSDGKFKLSDPHSHAASSGSEKSMGPTVLAEYDGILLMLTSIPSPPWDLVQWTSQGVDPKIFKVIGIKGAVAHRQTYDPICKSSFFVDTDGPSRSNLKKIKFKNIKRPIYPLDF